MARFSSTKVAAYLASADAATTAYDKGRVFEDLLSHAFGSIPGMELTARDLLNVAGSQEIDLAFWNDQLPNGLPFLPNVLLVEAKNWATAVGSIEIAWFDRKLMDRGQGIGVFVASAGITGDHDEKTRAHQIIASALAQGRRIIVITRDDLRSLRRVVDLVALIKLRLCQLAANGTAVL